MARATDIRIKPVVVDSSNKCGLCKPSKCCSYITQQIATPRSRSDFDHLLWLLSHHHIGIYKDEEGWFLLVETACRHIDKQGQCGIYEARPQICRDYSNDYCEYDSPAEEGFEFYFRNDDDLLKYCRKRFKRWDQWVQKRK